MIFLRTASLILSLILCAGAAVPTHAQPSDWPKSMNVYELVDDTDTITSFILTDDNRAAYVIVRGSGNCEAIARPVTWHGDFTRLGRLPIYRVPEGLRVGSDKTHYAPAPKEILPTIERFCESWDMDVK